MYISTIYSSNKANNTIQSLDIGYKAKWQAVSKKLISIIS